MKVLLFLVIVLVISNIDGKHGIFGDLIKELFGSRSRETGLWTLNILLTSTIFFLAYQQRNYRYFFLIKKIEKLIVNYYNFELTTKDKQNDNIEEKTIAFLFEELRKEKLLPKDLKDVLSIINKKSFFYNFSIANKINDYVLATELYTIYLESRANNVNSFESFLYATNNVVSNNKDTFNEMQNILNYKGVSEKEKTDDTKKSSISYIEKSEIENCYIIDDTKEKTSISFHIFMNVFIFLFMLLLGYILMLLEN